MRPTGIGHEAEKTTMSNQLIDQDLCILIMYIVIRRARDIQPSSTQMTRMRDW